MPDQEETTVHTESITSDGELTLFYTLKPDPPHNPLSYDFRWVNKSDEIKGGPFQSYNEALYWQEGYETAVRAYLEKSQISGETKVVE